MFGLKKLYLWTLSLAERPWALWALVTVAFVESAFFPLPPDILLIPLVLGAVATVQQRIKWWVFPLACTCASVAGGVLGYGIGALLMDSVGRPILALFHYQEKFENLKAVYERQGLIIVLLAGLTPIPYKVFTILSGAVGMSLPVFVGASFAARGLRFFALALLLRVFGAQIKVFIDRHFSLLTIVAGGLLVGGIVLLRIF